MSADILIVDDEEDIRGLIEGILVDEGYETVSCANSDKAYELLASHSPSLVILDIWLQGSEHDGLEILKNIHQEYPYKPVLMISGHGTIETAVAAIKDGAYDFIEKPFKSDRLLLMIKRALETAALKQENETLRRQTQGTDVAELAGSSPAIEKLKQVVQRAAPTNSRVLLTGEPGTGKNVVARLIHESSERAEKPYLVINCATLNPERLDIELFGSVESGETHTGLLEQANGGTLLLDEVADMSMETQAKIVRLLQEQRFQKIGSRDFVEVDVRILATTNKDLEEAIKQGDFREDFYYRLNVVPLHIPPLRERGGDIEVLVENFLRVVGAPFGIEKASFEQRALEKLSKYAWPGNVRQLRNVIEWVLIMHGANEGKPFTLDQLPPDITGVSNTNSADKSQQDGLDEGYMRQPLREAREMFEREYLLSQVERFDGNISKTAQFVQMERSALHRKLKSLRVHDEENKAPESTKDPARVRKRA